MTRVNGKGPKPAPRLQPVKVERSPVQSAVLAQIVGGPQDGAYLAVSVAHPDGVPLLAVQALMDENGRHLSRGAMDAGQAMRLIEQCT